MTWWRSSWARARDLKLAAEHPVKAAVCTRYGPPEVLQIREVAKPRPKANELCIRIFATAVTASDCIVRAFDVPFKMRLPMGIALGFTGPRKPILGMVLAGEVESVGEDMTRFKPGDQVYAMNHTKFGSYAEYICLRQDLLIAPKPSNLTYEEAAAIPYGGLLALHFLQKASLQAGRRALIYGASGAIGTAAVQLARYFGAEVTGVCSTTNLELVKSLGAATVIDYTEEDFGNRGDLYDLIFNAVGGRKARLQPQGSLTPTGKHITVDDALAKPRLEDLVLLTELVEAGTLKPVIDRTYPLEKIAEAHRYVDQGHKKGNVVITVWPSR
jgi:NADPH:quinone reductase-like Zn-dependent oxidoreductase